MPFPASLTQTLNAFRLAPYPSVTGAVQSISVKSLGEFSFALVWGWLMLVSFAGWGRLLGKLLRLRPLPASVACSLGIAVVIFIGGWLNLFHAIYPVLLIALIFAGILMYLILRTERPEAYRWLVFWNKTSRWSRALIILTLLLLILRVAGTVRLATYHNYDDGTAYLAFPQKMLATHRFAPDPFSDRRLISSLGGSYLLQACVIAATSLSNVGMADRALGLMLMLVAIFDIAVAFGVSTQWLAGMVFLAYLVPQETFNLTFIILPIPLFLAMTWAAFETLKPTENDKWRHAVIVGAIGGGAICLKSTFLPYVGAIALFPYLLLLWNKKRAEAVGLPLIAGVASLAVLAGWMIAMRHASGTYLFPLLGHGVNYVSYGLFPHLSRFAGRRALVRVFLQGAALLVLAAVRYFAGIQESKARFGFAILIAAAVAITAFNYESGGDYIWRYNFPQFFTAMLIFFATSLTIEAGSATRRIQFNRGVAVAALAGCTFYYDVGGGSFAPFSQMTNELVQYPCDLKAGLSGRKLASLPIRKRYFDIVNAIPPQSVSLDDTSRTFLLRPGDDKTFLIDDWPGAAGPRPGWPYTKDPEAVARYLRQNSVRYVIFDYAYGEWVDMVSCQSLVNPTHYSQLDHALELITFITHRQFGQLRTAHRSLYDDGRIAVIDLKSSSARTADVEPTWTLDTSETHMCSQIARRYMDTHASYRARYSGCE